MRRLFFLVFSGRSLLRYSVWGSDTKEGGRKVEGNGGKKETSQDLKRKDKRIFLLFGSLDISFEAKFAFCTLTFDGRKEVEFWPRISPLLGSTKERRQTPSWVSCFKYCLLSLLLLRFVLLRPNADERFPFTPFL